MSKLILTRRIEITSSMVQLLASGKSNKQAADALGISLNTVETHRKNVMSKLDLRSASDLVRYAIRNKLVEP